MVTRLLHYIFDLEWSKVQFKDAKIVKCQNCLLAVTLLQIVSFTSRDRKFKLGSFRMLLHIAKF